MPQLTLPRCPHTVTTLPEETCEAFSDHCTLARSVDANVDEEGRVWVALAEVGVDMPDVAVTLENQGVAAFEQSFEQLLEALYSKREVLETR